MVKGEEEEACEREKILRESYDLRQFLEAVKHMAKEQYCLHTRCFQFPKFLNCRLSRTDQFLASFINYVLIIEIARQLEKAS